MRKTSFWWGKLVITGLLVLLFGNIFAWSQVKFTVGPSRFEFSIPAGGKENLEITVHNRGDTELPVQIYLEDYFVEADGNVTYSRPGYIPRSICGWIQVKNPRITLKPKETRVLTFKLSVPETASGSYWGMISFEPVRERPEPKVVETGKITFGVTLSYVLGVFVYESVFGTLTKEGKLTDMKIVKSAEGHPLIVELEFENTGNAHLRPEGRVEFRDEKGETIGELPIESFVVLPNSKRRIKVEYTGDSLLPGRYLAIAILDFGGEHIVAAQRVFDIGND